MEEPTNINEAEVLGNEQEEKIQALEQQLAETNAQLNTVTNMLRFTLGVAIQAQPNLKQLQAMVNNLYKVD